LTVYWAGPLFTQAERLWNRRCARALQEKGYSVVLPQDEADKFRGANGDIDFLGLAEDCYHKSVECDVMIVVLDGADSDSGTSLEAGLRVGHRRAKNSSGKIIGVRTDPRASEDGKLNAMFRLLDKVIYADQFGEDLETFCEIIHQEIVGLCAYDKPSRARKP
jgi:nucleoside 2-deoxyribosyltransferase